MRAVAALALLLLAGCGDDGTRPPIDPIITDLTARPPIVGTGDQVTVVAAGYDREHFPLTYQWGVSGGTLEGAGDTVVWVAPETEGTYTVYLTLLDEEGGTDSDSVLVDVWDGSLLLNTGGGLISYNFDGTHHKMTEGRNLEGLSLLKADDVEVLGTEIFLGGVNGGYRILNIGHDGQVLSYTLPFGPSIYAVGFTVLPDGGFAVLDNLSDSVHFADSNGSPVAVVPIPDPLPGYLGRQNLDALVAGNRLIASETGRGRIFGVDLDTHELFVLLEFPKPDVHLGAIAQDADGAFHVYVLNEGRREIHSFTEGTEVRKLCTLPEEHVSGLVSVGAHLFATLNRAGAVYRINRFSGKHERVLDGLEWPTDIEYLPVRVGG